VIDLANILQARPDLAALVKLGMEAVIKQLLVVERERDAARSAKTPIGDSRTTHAPPSTDPRPKPRSQRRKTGRKTGGQPGHPGHRLEPVAKPDVVVAHAVTTCSGCQRDLTKTNVSKTVAHQVFELPKMPLVVTEHRLESKRCPCCATSPSRSQSARRRMRRASSRRRVSNGSRSNGSSRRPRGSRASNCVKRWPTTWRTPVGMRMLVCLPV
jgi:hypothetical protein